jgi:hypothetical protein
MRVLLSCLQSPKRHALAAYDFWRSHFLHGCREAGLECLEVPAIDWAEGLTYLPGDDLEAWRARTWDAVLAFARREHARRTIDFFLGYLYPAQIETPAIAELRRLGIPCVNFFCDNVREFRSVPAEFRLFDLHWVPEFEALPMYRRAGLPHVHAPMPCWVPPELRTAPVAETEPPTFIGSADDLRRDLFGHALQAGADFMVRGPGWVDQAGSGSRSRRKPRSIARLIANQWKVARNHGMSALLHKLENRRRPLNPPPIPADRVLPLVAPDEYLRVSREAIVTIGVNRVPTARASDRLPLAYSRLRDIEAPMLGACYLTEQTAGLGELYELGAEIETYRTAEELAAKLDELTSDPPRRRSLRERGQRRALEEHSAARSLRRIAGRLTGREVL